MDFKNHQIWKRWERGSQIDRLLKFSGLEELHVTVELSKYYASDENDLRKGVIKCKGVIKLSLERHKECFVGEKIPEVLVTCSVMKSQGSC